MYRVRLLERADLAACMALKDEAGWNQTEQDWLELFERAPQGCFGIDAGGALAGTATVVCYGTDLAWIGMVLTASRFRRRGIATALVEHALAYAQARCIAWTKLDATPLGRPLYSRLGFEDECAVERWLRPGAPARTFQSESLNVDAGFARGRAGSQAAYFGPCQADSPQAARHLLEWFLNAHRGEAIFWDLLPDNAAAMDLATGYGFTRVRQLVRMARRMRCDAPPLPTDKQRIYAIAGFEWG
jgi:GNAT superfamily N-acetyltransferase